MLVEDATQTRTGRWVMGPRRVDELTDLVECQAQSLRLANELEPVEVYRAVESIPARAPGRWRKKPVKVVVAESLHGES
jgi:hypothetical protein